MDASDEAGEEIWTRASGAVFGPNQEDEDVVHVKLNRGGAIAHFLPDEYLGPNAGVVYPSVDKLLSDSSLMDNNDSFQGIIDTVREKLKSEVGLTDADFHEVPVLC